MADSVLMKGNEALAEAAIRAGCRYYFGYPITPQNEISEYMARRLRDEGGVFLQAESEVSAINMVYGAGGAGARVMTSSSSPGVSLMQEGISYIAGAQVPCVIVNMSRGGPGLGGIQPSQSDYFQATKGGGHGDYRLVVYGPSSIQEACDLMGKAFDVADKYRAAVVVLGDGNIGQMMEPVTFPERLDPSALPKKDWAATGRRGRDHNNQINSIVLDPEELDAHNWRLQKKYDEIKKNEVMYEIYEGDDAEWFLVAYGTVSRICKLVVQRAREKGIKLGLVRPITLWPFPYEAFDKVAAQAKGFLCVELSTGQMVEDVRLAVNGRAPVHFYGRTGGAIPGPRQIERRITDLAAGKPITVTDYYDRESGGERR